MIYTMAGSVNLYIRPVNLAPYQTFTHLKVRPYTSSRRQSTACRLSHSLQPEGKSTDHSTQPSDRKPRKPPYLGTPSIAYPQTAQRLNAPWPTSSELLFLQSVTVKSSQKKACGESKPALVTSLQLSLSI